MDDDFTGIPVTSRTEFFLHRYLPDSFMSLLAELNLLQYNK